MSASLSTHVLDTGAGRPAHGVRVELFAGEKLLARSETREDGRIPELADGHHHVPLVVSPYGCASYRGS